ncbi:hypothetical protein [Ovoidimarina sediminis]|uniref:hypothetical protein n=1 Tax=Ovoidimarina sediminis TaxID=3079856 RepID=UPI0029072F9E|nr:hypothetical protein [Rhodophyticola sp. MJ-SS7]MDU8946476.1 hypothetical protein [Rhodophyticola sp. MJ-SS7]
MHQPRSLFLNWILLVLVSTFTGAVGIFLVYLTDGYTVSSAAGFALSVAAVFSGGIAVFVVIGPLLTVWSIWEIYGLGVPHDGNLLALAFSLPSTIVLIVVASAYFLSLRVSRRAPVWLVAFLVSPLVYSALALSADELFQP